MIKRVIISGGGTGGHIFPALAIANEIKSRNPEVEILFVGALGKMEMKKFQLQDIKSLVYQLLDYNEKSRCPTLYYLSN